MDLNIGQNKWEEIMSVKDTIKKSVLESGTFAQYDMLREYPKVCVNLQTDVR